MATTSNTPPLVVFALDGADSELVDRWSKEGYLPALASIAERGARARIAGPELMSTAGAWLSLFSGVSRSEHGYYADRQLIPGTYEVDDLSARDADARPFWSRLAGGSRKIAIVDALEAQPVAGLPGVQLADWAVQEPFDLPGDPPVAEPASFLDEVRRIAGEPPRVDVFKPGSSVREDMTAHRSLLERIEQKGMLCRHLLARDRCDLMVLSFVEAHTAAHRLWDYRPGGSRHDESGELRTAIRSVYQAIDREIGLMLNALPADSNVFVLSLFGMRDLYPTDGLMEAFCRKLGYEAPLSGAAKSRSILGLLRRTIDADVRARLSRLLPKRVRLGLQAERSRCDTDWGKTRAFCLPSLNTGFVRVNCRGREPQGIVDPGSEYENLLKELESDLAELVDVRSGEPAVANVIRSAEAFGCGPIHGLPDLIVEWKTSAYLMDRVRHPRAELVQARQHYNRSSHHSMAGFMAAAGPSINAGIDIGEVSPLDFAPAFLAFLGEPSAGRTSGRLFDGLVAP